MNIIKIAIIISLLTIAWIGIPNISNEQNTPIVADDKTPIASSVDPSVEYAEGYFSFILKDAYSTGCFKVTIQDDVISTEKVSCGKLINLNK